MRRLIFALVLCWGWQPARAQPLQERGYEPVEQALADMDPLARNTRHVEAGIAQQGGQSSRVFRQINGDNRLYYVAPGVTASYDRSSYLWFKITKKHWKLFQVIPPNTVFFIGGPPVMPSPPDDSPPNLVRVSASIDARVDGSVQPVAPESDRAAIDDATRWASYRRFCQAQRQAVLNALDPAPSSGPVEPRTNPGEAHTGQ